MYIRNSLRLFLRPVNRYDKHHQNDETRKKLCCVVHTRSNINRFGRCRKLNAAMMDSLLAFSIFAVFNLSAVVSGVHSSASSSSQGHPSSLLAKSISGGSTDLKPLPEETSSLFGIGRNSVAPEDETIHVVKRDGSKEPLERSKVRFSLQLLFVKNSL